MKSKVNERDFSLSLSLFGWREDLREKRQGRRLEREREKGSEME